MTKVLVILYLLYATTAGAASWQWDTSDYIHEGVAEVLTVVDWGQTSDLQRRGRIEHIAIKLGVGM